MCVTFRLAFFPVLFLFFEIGSHACPVYVVLGIELRASCVVALPTELYSQSPFVFLTNW